MSQSRTEGDDVQAATDQYHNAQVEMANGEASALADMWSHEDDVTTMRPTGGRVEGWEAVNESWQGFPAVCSDGTVERTDQVIRVTCDLAYELCTESASVSFADEPISMEHRTTRCYRKENGEWKVVRHHADLVSEFAEEAANIGA